MSRAIGEKIIVKGELIAQTPISVGGIGTGDHVDLDLAVDGKGVCHIPGTSLAGPMRAWLSERVDERIVKDLFGYIEQKKSDSGKASALFVADSPVSGAVRERRHGIGINPDTGTVKDGFLYTRALLPRGASFPLRMELDIKTSAGESYMPGTLAVILKALQNGEICFGACKTRGLGVLKLEKLKIERYNFIENINALDAWLEYREAPVKGNLEILERFKKPDLEPGRRHSFEIKWKPASDLMVKSGRDGASVDMLPLMSGVKGGLAPVIPGSSIKGTLRAQALKILHTVFASASQGKYPEEIYTAIADDMFGSTEKAGRIRIDDVYCRLQNPLRREEWVSEKEETLKSLGEKKQYVAIDRFTGGASDGALYSALPVKQELEWEPMKIALNLSDRGGFAALNEDMRNMELALLKLLFRDMQDGFVTLGFGSRRGMGEIEIIDCFGDFDDAKLQAAWDKFVSDPESFKPREPEMEEGQDE